MQSYKISNISSPGYFGGYGGAFPAASTYSQVSHHGWGGLGGLYGYGSHLPVSSVSHVSHGAHYGGWGYPGLYGGVQVSQSPVRYHGYSVGTPHVQSYGVHYPTTSVTHHHGNWGLGGYGYGAPFAHSVQSVSHGFGHNDWGLGHGLHGFGHF